MPCQNFFWVPMAEWLGRRPVFLAGSLGLFICEIWSAVSPSFNSLLASRIVGAFMGSCTEALGAVVVNVSIFALNPWQRADFHQDLFFLHERGSKMGAYIVALYFGNSMGPLLTGFIVQGLDWRWASWICAILGGINFFGIILCFPESRFPHRVDTGTHFQEAVSGGKNVTEKRTNDQMIEQVGQGGDEALVGEKKSWVQQMNPWSGTSNHGVLHHIHTAISFVGLSGCCLGLSGLLCCAGMANRGRHPELVHLPSASLQLFSRSQRFDWYTWHQ
jgi:MFS family permease